MGVPALFRWLSKKYPKIVLPVSESLVFRVGLIGAKLTTLRIDLLPNSINRFMRTHP